jgi:tRNA-specific 2-thiouridylase
LKKKIVAAMSGGVDSSVAAALLAEQGWEVVGVTLKLLERAETGFGCCGSPADVDDAKRVCEKIGIPHYTVDMAALFNDKVIKRFVDDYLRGRTPNPCVECNRSVKFGHLLALAEAWNCEGVATGHYARSENGRLLKSVDQAKDQTYFLYSLTSKELAKVFFPVGSLTKPQVREKARALGLRTADKPESQEICFVPARDYRSFVAERAPRGAEEAALKPGKVVDAQGRALASHDGTAGYTIGQRKGLGVTAPEPRYVIALEPETATVVVGTKDEVLSKAMRVEAVTWTGAEGLPADGRIEVRIRHRHTPAPATASALGHSTLHIVFDEPQRAVTPGQAAVFYRADAVVGGGVIARRGER